MIDSPVQYIKGIGPKRAKLLEKIGIFSVKDLITHFPREYSDRRVVNRIVTITKEQKAHIIAKVETAQVLRLSMFLNVFKVALNDGSGIIYAVFYRKVNPYFKHDVFGKLKKDFTKGNKVFVFGDAEVEFGEKQIKVAEYELLNDENIEVQHKIVPIYPLTENLHQKWMRTVIEKALEKGAAEIYDIIPKKAREEYSFANIESCIKEIHFPESFETAEKARKMLAFEEFYLHETALSLMKTRIKAVDKKRKYVITKNLLTPFKEKLGFEFTPAQKKVINEIFSDMQTSKPMNRLLMGDVGSGKTVVALSSALLAVENGFQAAFLAPTELLATQHYLTIKEKLSGLAVNVVLLTSKLSAERKKTISDIKSSKANIIIGTHAILEKSIEFAKLGLVIIDEQHRFGVIQRQKLLEKSEHPDVLVMTATPIPRTLALTLYGDLDVSIIDSLPPGRKSIRTIHMLEYEAYEFVKKEIKAGRQCFIVFPLVEETDKSELKAAVNEAQKLSGTVFNGYKVGLVHGQMKHQQKDSVMAEFKNGQLQILISTTVIEVGIDVPNATVMVIQHSERFGLAALHQLRGRVGRGSSASYCILLGDAKSENARKRIQIMLSTNDGFKIAQEDLQLRGPGEFFGISQHGALAFKAANILTDLEILESSRIYAKNTIEVDPTLKIKDNYNLRTELLKKYGDRLSFIKVA